MTIDNITNTFLTGRSTLAILQKHQIKPIILTYIHLHLDFFFFFLILNFWCKYLNTKKAGTFYTEQLWISYINQDRYIDVAFLSILQPNRIWKGKELTKRRETEIICAAFSHLCFLLIPQYLLAYLPPTSHRMAYKLVSKSFL